LPRGALSAEARRKHFQSAPYLQKISGATQQGYQRAITGVIALNGCRVHSCCKEWGTPFALGLFGRGLLFHGLERTKPAFNVVLSMELLEWSALEYCGESAEFRALGSCGTITSLCLILADQLVLPILVAGSSWHTWTRFLTSVRCAWPWGVAACCHPQRAMFAARRQPCETLVIFASMKPT
jgi:hypothetical protein